MKNQAKLHWPVYEIWVFIALLGMDVDMSMKSQTTVCWPVREGLVLIADASSEGSS